MAESHTVEKITNTTNNLEERDNSNIKEITNVTTHLSILYLYTNNINSQLTKKKKKF